MAPSKVLIPSAQTQLVLDAMGDNSTQIQATLSSLMERIDAMTNQMGDFGKQLIITQESV
jgi:hypothetical protein